MVEISRFICKNHTNVQYRRIILREEERQLGYYIKSHVKKVTLSLAQIYYRVQKVENAYITFEHKTYSNEIIEKAETYKHDMAF